MKIEKILNAKNIETTAWISSIAAIIYLIYEMHSKYTENIGNIITSDLSRWGQTGDFFGGILNPILSFTSLVILIRTLHLQRRELALSTKELRKSAEALANQNRTAAQQIFETTFFRICESYLSNCEDFTRKRDGSGESNIRKIIRTIDSYASTTKYDAQKQRESLQEVINQIQSGRNFKFQMFFEHSKLLLDLVHNSNEENKEFYLSYFFHALDKREIRLLAYIAASKPNISEKSSFIKAKILERLDTNNIKYPFILKDLRDQIIAP